MAAYDPNLSELESLSDSDWLDLASNRGGETDDDGASSTGGDSLASGDDDREDQSSTGAHEVDHWEGFNDDGPSRAPTPPPSTPPAGSPPGASAAALLLYRRNGLRPTLSPLARNALATEEDLVEDERVQSALDQSMVSTLSTSSSHSRGSGELRLSFPDPLSSSRDTLMNSSYEDVHESLSANDADTEPEDGTTDVDVTLTSFPSTSPSDPGTPPTPVVQERELSPVKIPPMGHSIKDHLRSPHVPTIVALLSLVLGYIMFGMSPTPSQLASVVNDTTHYPTNTTSIPPLSQAVELTSTGLSLIPAPKSDVAIITVSSTSALSVVPNTPNAVASVPQTSSKVAVASRECAAAPLSNSAGESSSAPVASTSTSALQVQAPTSLGLTLPAAPGSVSVHTPAPPVATLLKPDIKGKGKAFDPPAAEGTSIGAWIGDTLEAFLRMLGLGDVYEVRRELERAYGLLKDAIQHPADWVQQVLQPVVHGKSKRSAARRGVKLPGKDELKAGRTRAKSRARVLRQGVVEHVKDRAKVARGKLRHHKAIRKVREAAAML